LGEKCLSSVRQGEVEEEGGPPRPRGWGEGGNKRGGRKGHDKKQSGREGGREGSKHRDVIRVEKRHGFRTFCPSTVSDEYENERGRV